MSRSPYRDQVYSFRLNGRIAGWFHSVQASSGPPASARRKDKRAAPPSRDRHTRVIRLPYPVKAPTLDDSMRQRTD
jgi:hypothetical protein